MLYRGETDGWWAESPDVLGYTAVDDSLEGLRKLVPEGISEFLDEPVLVIEVGSDLEKGMTASRADTTNFNVVGTTGLLPRVDFSGKRQDSTEASLVFGPRRFAST